MEEELLLQCQYCDRWVQLIRTTHAHTRHRNCGIHETTANEDKWGMDYSCIFHIINYSITSLICGVICDEKYAYQCISVCRCRWVHAVCESLYTEDEVEQASDDGFACTSCTPYVPKPVGKSEN